MPSALPDQAFLDRTADRLAGLPGVRAVALGGSRSSFPNPSVHSTGAKPCRS